MTTTATTPTVKDLIEFIYDNPSSSVADVTREFNIPTADAEELLNELDTTDGTIYTDDAGGYTIEDKEYSLDEVLHGHKMGGGCSLDQELPTNKKPARRKKRATKKPAKPTTAKKKAPKKAAKVKVVAEAAPKVEAVTPEPEAPKEKKKRVVKPRSSRFVEDAHEAQELNVEVGTEVKACVDCRVVYAKHGGQFRPRHRNPEGHRENNPDSQAHAKHVQPRCIGCDKLRSRRKSRFSALRKAVGVEDIGNPESIITHPDRKRGGVPDGKFSVVSVDDNVDGFTPTLRGVLVNMSEGLIRIRWASGDNPDILGATKKAIASCKAQKPKIVVPTKSKPKVAEPVKAKAPKKPAAKKRKTKAEKAAEVKQMDW